MARFRRGSPLVDPTPQEKFWSKVDKNGANGCWLWTKRDNGFGYGQFQCNGKITVAHRISYEWAKGPVPEGLVLDHLCRVRNCVNPDHLEAVTFAENVQRGISQKNALFCKNGHRMTTGHFRHDGKQRVCLQCNLDRGAKFRAKRKAEATL